MAFYHKRANFWLPNFGFFFHFAASLIALENGMNPNLPLNGCEINVHFCFV